MSSNQHALTLGFVWTPGEISSSVVETARRTGTRAIFDLSSAGLDSSEMALVQADAGGDAVDVKVSPEALLEEPLEDFLKETGLNRVWVELHPVMLDATPDTYLDRINGLSPRISVVPVVSDPALLAHILKDYHGIGFVALKGCEASGFVSRETTLTLFGGLRTVTGGRSDSPGVFIWGGVATPEAAAAFLSLGVKGVVFESLHWLTDLVAIDEDRRKKIAKLRPEHTDLTGRNLDVPCRLFNKGNSRSVKELREFAGSLCGAEIRDEQRRFFARKIADDAIAPLEGSFSREELIPLGTEAAFAASFARRFGTGTEEAINRFVDRIDALCRNADSKARAFSASPVAEEFGTRYPFVQGAMSWITDLPEFAVKVADAGALPTFALGLMDKATLERKLGGIRDILGARPFAVNVITLAENPHREDQLAWIRSIKPRFTVIAAGEPSHAKQLLEEGMEVIYIAPNEELLKMAVEAGVQYVICEGNEAGGHVGEHSTLTLAQIILDLKDRNPELLEGCRVILAGGFCNRETAFLGAMLGADALQMGTIYLTSKEIVETGALAPLYQKLIVESEPGGTVITGEDVGLRVRSLKTAKMDDICSLERDFAAGSEGEDAFREKLEALAAGSLLIAARGLETPNGPRLDDRTCIEQGQFMSGASAGTLREIRTLEQQHAELAEGRLAPGLPFVGPVREPVSPRVAGVTLEESEPSTVFIPSRRAKAAPRERERIAVTGMSIVNSLGNSPEEVWAASVAMKSGIIRVPKSKWDHEIFYHPRPRMPEKTYSKVGAFQNLEVSRKDVGIPPQDFRTMTDSTRITMWLATQAVEKSGILDSDIPRERIGVLISQNSGEAAATLSDLIIRGSASQIVTSVGKVLPLTPESEKAVEEEVKAGRMAIDDTTLLGRLNCSAGGFICNKYGFMGPSFSVSAACATALVALFSAYQMIRNGIIDAAVIGGAEELLTPMHFLEFSALGALQGLSGVDRPPAETSRPFDMDRDGMVLGEGGGMIVIERESLARRRGAEIHAFITAMGASNNHLGMVESSRETQELAMGACYEDAPYGPDAVDMIECHATSTIQGDVEELHALTRFFDREHPTVLTSFKSQIGHTLGASGVNSLIRGTMAVKSGIYPPTLNFTRSDPDVDPEAAGFFILPQPGEWKRRNGFPRRFQVNAFGFGGSNYVVQVEECMDGGDSVMVLPDESKDPRNEGQRPSADLQGVSLFRTRIGSKPYRLAVVADSEAEAQALVKGCEPLSESGPIPAKTLRALAKKGVYLAAAEQPAPPLAFVFPGQGSHYAGMSHELYETFPVIREWMDRVAEVADFDILNLLFHDREEDLQKTRWQQPALFTMEYAMVQYLMALGMKPSALAGHSLGELTALCLAGVYSFADGFRIVNMRAICMDKACTMNVDPGVMMAADAPLDYLEEIIAERDGIYVTNINSPRQVVLGGDTEAVTALGDKLKAEGYRRTLLKVSMAFHSPIMACIHDELQAFVDTIEFHPPRIPVISNTTMQPYPLDSDEIKRIIMAHLESPVHWQQNVQTLWDDFGVRLFVEVGPGQILSNLIGDCLPEAECIQTCQPSAESATYRAALARLAAKGCLAPRREPRAVTFPGQETAIVPVAPAPIPVDRVSGATGLEQIVQREINSFLIESFGRFLKPGILAAIQKQEPGFSEKELDGLLARMYGNIQIPATIPVQAPAAPAHPPEPADASPAIEAPVTPVEPSERIAMDSSDVTESIIRIIMDATGYERDEIEPDMDLREDLAIRSSRLPVIMDALEEHFRIKIEIEEFMDVRTIADISEKIAEMVPEATDGTTRPATSAESQAPIAREAEVPVETEKEPIKRIVFREIPVQPGGGQRIELNASDAVVTVGPEVGSGLVGRVGDLFREDFGIEPVAMAFKPDASAKEGAAFDMAVETQASEAALKLGEVESLAGLVFVLDEFVSETPEDMRRISGLLNGLFVMAKAFLDSPSRKFLFLVYRDGAGHGPTHVLAQGLLGMFLSLGHELPSVQFRTIQLDDSADPKSALREALDRSQPVIQTIYRGEDPRTVGGAAATVDFPESPSLEISQGDVVVLSGGGYGVTNHLARSLAPLGCRIVFFGRTMLDPDIDFGRLLELGDDAEEALAAEVEKAKAGLADWDPEREVAKASKALEIIRNVEALRAQGVEAAYYRCDVTDVESVNEVMQEIGDRFGRIDGIVHGAGVIKDRPVKEMSAEDFASVADVKLLGAWNLYEASIAKGLKFFVSLSSGACIQGNPGQSNYTAGNRAMSALMDYLRKKDESVLFKALMLPPIEGTGMAEDPDIRALMKRMNAGYVHADELAGVFTRELMLAPASDVWVLFMRSLPDVKTVLLDSSEEPVGLGKLHAATLNFESADLPMIDAITGIDLKNGMVKAARAFSLDKDLWMEDHRPFKFIKYPMVSAIMAVETFMEACSLLYPHLRVQCVRNVEFKDLVKCGPGEVRESIVTCKTREFRDRSVLCDAAIETREMSPSGKPMDRMSLNFLATVVMGAEIPSPARQYEGFPVKPEEFDTRPMDRAEAETKYDKHSRLAGRYRVIQEMYGSAPDTVSGRIVYRQSDDFAAPLKSRYKYSPYLFEALMHTAIFYVFMRNEDEERVFIPFKLDELVSFRQCTDGESVELEGRLRHRDDIGLTWDARALDQDGRVLMHLRGMEFRWFTG